MLAYSAAVIILFGKLQIKSEMLNLLRKGEKIQLCDITMLKEK